MKIMLRFILSVVTEQILKQGGTKTVFKVSKKLFFLLLLIMVVNRTEAIPSFARQTGLSCTACHTSFPELTSFGRLFKLNGYTMTTVPTIEAKDDSARAVKLNLLRSFPLSAMVQSSFTLISKDIEDTQNNSVALPQQLSVFLAGQITPHLGAFIQITYDGESFGMDNTDIRFANQASIGSKSLVYGLTLNNNPTVQDLWNSTPAWGFPFASSDAGPGPAKSTLIENLGMQVAGLGAYALFDNLIYTEFSLYRSAQQGAPNPADNSSSMVIKGASPYWRLALQHDWSKDFIEIGTFGISSRQYLDGISGNMDNFTDLGFDFQYQRNLTFGFFSLHSSYIYEAEKRYVSAAAYSSFHFNSFKLDGNLYFSNGMEATLAYFNTWGTQDPDVVGSLTGKPDSNGLIAQIGYMPWDNTRIMIQYTMFNKFDGGSSSYDESGRSAPNNNTLYLLAWINF
jgi:hypothetical protein